MSLAPILFDHLKLWIGYYAVKDDFEGRIKWLEDHGHVYQEMIRKHGYEAWEEAGEYMSEVMESQVFRSLLRCRVDEMKKQNVPTNEYLIEHLNKLRHMLFKMDGGIRDHRWLEADLLICAMLEHLGVQING